MIYDLEAGLGPGIGRADVCVVGAGAAGILLAVELARRGRRVLLLESGGREEEVDSQNLYASELAGLKHEGIHLGRFRIHGGTTTQWGGQILELFEDDFEPRPWIKGSGWPISKATLKPYYPRAIELEGLGGAMSDDREVWRDLKADFPPLGPDLRPFFSRWCREANFARLFSDDLHQRENLHVVLHANACEVLLASDGRTVRGLRARTLSGKEAIFEADSYVLCLGGIETSRFLLQPHAEGRAPWHANPHLGRNFQDHLDVYSAELKDANPRLIHGYFDPVSRRGFRYESRFRLSAEQQRQAGVLTVAGMVFFDCSPDDPRHRIWQTMKTVVRGRLNRVRAKHFSELMMNLPMLFRQMYRHQVQGRSYHPEKGTTLRLRVFCEQEPLGESRITLSREKDALGQFRARLDWRISELELKSIRYFVETVRRVFAEQGLARVVPDADLMGRPGEFVPKIMDSYHHMGGARMANSPADGVVDLDLKVHGTRNLYLCGSAVFPCSGFSNPTHTILALAVRLADHLQKPPGAEPAVAAARSDLSGPVGGGTIDVPRLLGPPVS